jgi:hypothetical protein
VKGLARRPSANNLTARARQAALSHMLAQVAEDDVSVLHAAARARELNDGDDAMLALGKSALESLGWTREELRVALDARKSSKEAPFYLRMTHERTIMRYRGQDGAPPPQEAQVIIPGEEPDTAQPPAELPPVPEEEPAP